MMHGDSRVMVVVGLETASLPAPCLSFPSQMIPRRTFLWAFVFRQGILCPSVSMSPVHSMRASLLVLTGRRSPAGGGCRLLRRALLSGWMGSNHPVGRRR